MYLARIGDTKRALAPRHTADEWAALLGQRWWSHDGLAAFQRRLLPPALPRLLAGELTARSRWTPSDATVGPPSDGGLV